MAQPASSSKRPATWGAVTVLLTVAIIGTLWVPIYARSAPKLGPLPLLLLVPAHLGAGGRAVLCWICYLLLKTRPMPIPARQG